MAMNYPVKTAGGSAVLPTADATLYTDSMSADFSAGVVSIEFFSDAEGKVPANPTGGTVSVFGTPSGNVWLTPSSGGVVQANAVLSPKGTYTQPYFSGGMIKGRVELVGITGAAYARITFWRA